MTHWRWPSVKPRSAWAAGRAMLTTVESSTTMSCARATTLSVHHRRDGASGAVGAFVIVGEFWDMSVTLYGTVEFRIPTVPEFTCGQHGHHPALGSGRRTHESDVANEPRTMNTDRGIAAMTQLDLTNDSAQPDAA